MVLKNFLIYFSKGHKGAFGVGLKSWVIVVTMVL